MPDPPPVQKRTFPLKISCLKIDVDSTVGTTCGEDDIGSRTPQTLTSVEPLTLTRKECESHKQPEEQADTG